MTDLGCDKDCTQYRDPFHATSLSLFSGTASNLNVRYPGNKENNMPDKTLVCKDCSKEFVFTEGEQDFYKEKGLTNEPQRCPDCRKAKKQQFNRNNYDRRY